MNSDIAEPLAGRGGYPILSILTSFPIACFTCALFTDIAYVQTANIMWADFSAWLLAVGMVGAVVAALLGLLSLVTRRRGRAQRPVGPIALGSLLVVVIALLNNFVHSRDGWTSVMPLGIALSAITVLVMLVTAWLAFSGGRQRRVVTTYTGVAR